MTGDYMLLLILCIPFAGALVTLLLRGGEKGAGESSDGKKKRDIWTGLITAAEMLIFASLFVIFLAGGRTGIAFDFQWEGFCGLGLHLCMDGLRALYCLVASLMWMMTSFFSMEYMGSYTSRNRYRFFTLLILGATVGVFLSADLYTAFIFFEIMSFTSYTWVAHEETKEALRAAETYLAVAVIGGLVMLMGLFILYRELGTLEITALAEAVRSHTLAEPFYRGILSAVWLRRQGRCIPASHLASQGPSGSSCAGFRVAFGDSYQGGDFRCPGGQLQPSAV